MKDDNTTNNTTNNTTLIEFPCDFNIKIIGTNNDTFANDVLNIACKHFPGTKDTSIRSQLSQQGNFLSITLTVYAQNKATLDSLYIELTGHPDIKMVL